MALPAPAVTVLSNLGISNTTNGDAPITNDQSSNSASTVVATYVAESFVVGSISGNTWNLDSATLRMDDAISGTTGSFSVAIYANNPATLGDRPGTVLGTLSGSVSPTTAGDYTYTATAGNIQLTAGSTYWLVAQAPNTIGSNQAYNWKFTDNTNFSTQSTGWTVNPAQFLATFTTGYQSDNGSWYDQPNAGSPGHDNIVWHTASAGGSDANNYGADTFLAFSLSASAPSGVPEPSRAMFGLLGLLSLGLRRTRCRG